MKKLGLIVIVGTVASVILMIREPSSSDTELHDAGVKPRAEEVTAEAYERLPTSGSSSPLSALVETDPLAALARIAAIENAMQRRRAIVDAALIWAEREPSAILDAILAMKDAQLREELLSAALSAWSAVDAVSMFRYVASVDDWDLATPGVQTPGNIRLGYTLGPDTDFKELAALVDALPPPFDGTLRRNLIRGLAEQDVFAAVEFLDTLPAEEQRQAGFVVANAYAEVDPAAAFQWARGSGLRGVAERVLVVYAEADPIGALNLAAQAEETAFLLAVTRSAVQSEAVEPEAFASALLAMPDSARREQAIERLVEVWSVDHPEQVLEWLAIQGGATSPALFGTVAGRLEDPNVAAQYINRIPAASRSEWIQTFADGLASRDPAGALTWISQFRDEPAYSASVAVIARHMASYDPRGAANLLQSASLEGDLSAVSQVANSWAVRDPRGAVNWLQGLKDNSVRMSALRAVARTWTIMSPTEAEQWVMSLPARSERDDILGSMITAADITNTEPSDRLFEGFSNDYARQVAAANAARRLSERNEPAARRLLDRHVTDPDLRQRFFGGDDLPSEAIEGP